MDGNILQKIKEHGLAGSMKVVEFYAATAFNDKWFYYYKKHRPMDEHLIVMESEGDLSDNAFALYDYMRHNNYLKKYHVAWLVDHVDEARALQQKRPEDFPNTEFVQKVPQKVNRRWAEVLANCKWYIYDHCNLLAPLVKRENQKVIYLCHGFAGYKASKSGPVNDKKIKTHDDYINVTGSIPEKVLHLYRKELYGARIVQIGFSRLDYFYCNNTEARSAFDQHYKLSKYNKVFLWMPTFRQSINKSISEDYQNNETKLPLFYSLNSLKEFNDYLKKINSLVILKIHHLQKNEKVFSEVYSNILFVSDENIKQMGFQLYQFIPLTDALITDYSSISADYMLLNKPMIFILDDYEQYDKSRGIIPENAKELWTGDQVYTINELMNAMDDIVSGKDKYKDKRNKLLPQFYKYMDGNSSNRILDYYDIKL